MKLAVASLLVTIVALCIVLVDAQALTRTSRVSCTTRSACFPWTPAGPACNRGNRMNLRFMLDVAPENQNMTGKIVKNVTFPFCPVVDELQAFNITGAGPIALVYQHGTTIDPNSGLDVPDWRHADIKYSYLYGIGLGDTRDIELPQEGSEGRVMIAENVTACFDNRENGVAIVPFLVLNLSMDEGKFRYSSGHPQPGGVGFLPSCDENDVCRYDVAQPCIGETPGRKNCAVCYDNSLADAQLVAELNIQIWASYYGKDATGRLMLSGAQNPLNFQAFSGSGVYSSMRTSFQNIKEGRSVDDEELGPENNSGQQSRFWHFW